MKTIYPKYAKKFNCIASDCPDTCCAQWEVVIDEKFQEIYKNSSSPAAKRAVSAMYTDSDGDVCLKLINNRCPMLNESNLCDIYIHMGKDALCDVCRVYPRFNKDCDEYIFSGISLSCPESARIILADDQNGTLSEIPCFADEVSSIIFDAYMFFAHKAKSCDFFALSDICQNIQDEIDFGDYDLAREIMTGYDAPTYTTCAEEAASIADSIKSMEFLTDEWSELAHDLDEHLHQAVANKKYRKKRDAAYMAASVTDEIANIRVYYLFKYLAEAIEDSDIVSLYQRCRICTMIICELYAMEIVGKGEIGSDKKLRLAQLFSKEIEHNEDNLNKIY